MKSDTFLGGKAIKNLSTLHTQHREESPKQASKADIFTTNELLVFK